MRAARALLLCGLFAVAGCGYFNSLYNANRRFSEAEARAVAGETARARELYVEAIEKAATSYRKYPSGRWADDALILMARSYFALELDSASAAALRTALAFASDEDSRVHAHAVLGAVHVRLGAFDSARVHLDSAVARLDDDDGLAAFARLWRARAAFAQGRTEEAWTDLDAAARHRNTAYDAAIVAATEAAATRDSTRFAAGLAWLAGAPLRGGAVATLSQIMRDAAHTWSPAVAASASAPLANARWSNIVRDSIDLVRVEIIAAAGDTAAALETGTRIAESNRGGIGSAARMLTARLMLSRVQDVSDLEEVRSLLLPAFDIGGAVSLMQDIKAVQILMLRGETVDRALSLFAAAEMARDELHAPRLARNLFLAYARLVPASPWSGKALLAANALHADAESLDAIASASTNPYIRAARGDGEGAAIDDAEQKLAIGLEGIRIDARNEAVQYDVVVGRAVSVLDSTRTAARDDSTRIACGVAIDTLRIAGIRADSSRAACLRGDRERFRSVLGIDTVLLRDTTEIPRAPNEVGLPRGRTRPDTLRLRSP